MQHAPQPPAAPPYCADPQNGAPAPTALDVQIDGDHYKSMAIQPMEFCLANQFDFATSSAIKYITRRKGDSKKRAVDLRKAIHCIQLLAQHEGITL